MVTAAAVLAAAARAERAGNAVPDADGSQAADWVDGTAVAAAAAAAAAVPAAGGSGSECGAAECPGDSCGHTVGGTHDGATDAAALLCAQPVFPHVLL